MEKSHAVLDTKGKIVQAVTIVLLAFLAFLVIFPIIYITLGSFKSRTELLVGGMNIFPSSWHFENYANAWKQANFARYTTNSVIISLGVMIISLVFSTMAGYVFSRSHFRGKELVYGLVKPSDERVARLREKYGESAVFRARFAGQVDRQLAGGLSKERRTGVTKPV